MTTGRTIKMPAQTTKTDIAVLQVQVKNIEQDVSEIKNSLKEMHECLDRNATETREMLKEMRDEDTKAHKELGSKVSALEKWRWMMMGAGIVLGSIGFDMIAKLLK
jgi:septation ring formation regulator EzrA